MTNGVDEIVGKLQAWFSEAVVCQQSMPELAIERYQQILEVAPEHRDSWNNLALIYQRKGEVLPLKHLIETAPEAVRSHLKLTLAELLFRQEDWQGVVDLLQDKTGEFESSLEALALAGKALCELERYDQAFSAYQEALSLYPDSIIPLCRLAALCIELGQYEDAKQFALQARHMASSATEPMMLLALTARYQDDWTKASSLLRQALALSPNSVELWCDYGIVLHGQQKLQQALMAFDNALALQADHPLSNWNKSLVLLEIGRYADAWPAYEWRWRAGINGRMPKLDSELWQGQLLAGKRIMVFEEQGLGDCLQFLRYIQPLLQMGAEVYLDVPEPLHRVCKATWPDTVLASKHEAYVDYHTPIMNLPRWLDNGQSPQCDIPYLTTSEEAVEKWDRLLSGYKQQDMLQVGLVWQGSRRKGFARSEWLDNRRSMPLENFALFAEIQGITFHCLQKGEAPALEPASKLALVDLSHEIEDFADTAAYLTHLDLLISVDTSVVHLAGALGREVWLLNRFDSDWRWGHDRTDCDWYRTVRQFRQHVYGDWLTIMEEVARELKQLRGN